MPKTASSGDAPPSVTPTRMTTAAESRSGDEGRMTLIEHLTELRSRLIKIVLAVLGGAAIAFVFYPQIFDFLLRPYETVVGADRALDDQGRLLATDPLEGFRVRLQVATYGGISIAMPVILWQLWRFVSPGLYSHEKRYAVPFVISATLLFVMGAGLAYYTLPRALEFLVTIGGPDLVAAYRPAEYFRFITYMMLAFGIGFEFPILLIFLQLAGILRRETLKRVRRFALVGIVVVVAIITPSGDPISLLMLSGPMWLFYELSIVAGKFIEKRREARELEELP
jgi:sec-independent protein translocase protein TatC